VKRANRNKRATVTEQELIKRLKERDEAAYSEVLQRYGDALYSYAFGMTGDSQLSEDIVSETYLRLVQHIQNYVYMGAPLKIWLYRVAHNQAISALRKTKRIQPTPEHIFEQIEGTTDLIGDLVAQQENEALRLALNELTEDQRQVVLLRFMAEQSTTEVALVVEKSETAVRQLQLRALRTLNRLLQREYQEQLT
jgi:RNA polymerase sigma-70 factor, ECF subfamily